MMAFMYFPNVLKNNSVIAFCDNMAALQSAVNGASSAIDMCALAHLLSVRSSQLAVRLWIEYVQTDSNLADGGSRVGVGCELAKARGIALRYFDCPRLPNEFPHSFENSSIDLFWKGH